MAPDQGRIWSGTFRQSDQVIFSQRETAMSRNENRKNIWAVIGGGNGGQSAAAHLAVMGYPVRIYDVLPETISAIDKQGGIHVDGAVTGFGPVEKATLKMEEAVEGADVIMVIAPALYHRDIAEKMAPSLQSGQIILIHPGATMGAIEFRQVCREKGAPVESIIVAEAQSLLYACRAKTPGHAHINGMKQTLAIAALPSSRTNEAVKVISEAFPQIYGASNVLETSLTNLNAVMHPGPSLLNVSLIESELAWEYYMDGITPSIGSYAERLDLERLALGKAVNLELPGVLQMYRTLYGVDKPTLSETVKEVKAYRGIAGQKRIDTRYVLEDIPMGLVPMASLGEQLGVPVPMISTIIDLGSFLLQKDFVSQGRTMKKLGLDGLDASGLTEFVTHGA